MGGISKIIKKVTVNPALTEALKVYPNELVELKIGRLLSQFESEALGRELQHRGFLGNIGKGTSSIISQLGSSSLLSGLGEMKGLKNLTGDLGAYQGVGFPPNMAPLIQKILSQNAHILEISENFGEMETMDRLA